MPRLTLTVLVLVVCAVAVAGSLPARDRTVLVTACDRKERYWPRLRNLVGSVHWWEPTVPVVIYDLGLTDAQRAEAESWRGVEVRLFDFDAHPPHVRRLAKFAWKPLAMLDALQRLPTDDSIMMYQDAGQELRRPMDEALALVDDVGYMFVAQNGWATKLRCCGHIGELCVNATFEALGVAAEEYHDKMMCAGGIQAYRRDSSAVDDVLRPVVECALDPDCIAPPGATLGNHRFDQAAFSVVMAREGYQCQTDPKFWCNRGNNVDHFPNFITRDPRDQNNVLFFSRRGWEGWGPESRYEQFLTTEEPDRGANVKDEL